MSLSLQLQEPNVQNYMGLSQLKSDSQWVY